jgi:ectoine hydroxylase-related dioxygenase (phytanoyl-CoA dioxygenase family)
MEDLLHLERFGYLMLREAISPTETLAIREAAVGYFEKGTAQGRLKSRGVVYASRNVLDAPEEIADAWRRPALMQFLERVLGPNYGVVRGLYFDKPPERSWSLPWHKDLSIAVADNTLASSRFTSPTVKSGVPHIIAPDEVLSAMLTLRIHLDDATEENGPLQVLPGSHFSAGENDSVTGAPVTLFAEAGDVLAMRPLISHASGMSVDGTT